MITADLYVPPVVSPQVDHQPQISESPLFANGSIIANCIPRDYKALGLNEVGQTFYINTIKSALFFAKMGHVQLVDEIINWSFEKPDLNNQNVLAFIEDADLKFNVSKYLRNGLGSDILRSAMEKRIYDDRMTPVEAIRKAIDVVSVHLHAIASQSILDTIVLPKDSGREFTDEEIAECMSLKKTATLPKLENDQRMLMILTFLDDCKVQIRRKDPRTKRFV